VDNDTSRKLAAILVADIAEYSRLMGGNEEATHERVRDLQFELVEPAIAEHRGRLVKTMGDGFLATFESPVEAVRCAIVLQQAMAGRNQGLPKPQWIRYRIGVNLGDVIVDKDDVYGEGVNIAARLQQLADPGGVYISGGIYEQIKYKLAAGYQSLGDRKVKNIAEPVPIYRVLTDRTAFVRATRQQRWRKVAIAARTLIVIGGVGGGWYAWHVHAQQESSAQQNPAPTSMQQAAIVPPTSFSAATRPVKPSFTEPDMVALPGGTFKIGSSSDPSEQPVHRVTVKPFLIGRYPVTMKEWRDCVAANACANLGIGDDDTPVSNLSWTDAQGYTDWLSQVTGKKYRLLTEAEWEYAARAGTETAYWWGRQMAASMADCNGCGGLYDPHKPLAIGSFKANPFGIYDMAGGIAQWMADCWHEDYRGAPPDGSAWQTKDCGMHVLRGGSWRNDPANVRVSSREFYDATVRYPGHGLRVARWT
jgi:formylglycine-generating enzyme required for sulfatase activity/class 3 adenylate cyclase